MHTHLPNVHLTSAPIHLLLTAKLIQCHSVQKLSVWLLNFFFQLSTGNAERWERGEKHHYEQAIQRL